MPPSALTSQDNVNFKRILDDLKISYWLTDLNFVLLDVNETFLEFAGASRKNLIGRDMRTLISVEEIQMVEHNARLLKEGKKRSSTSSTSTDRATGKRYRSCFTNRSTATRTADRPRSISFW